MNNKYLDNASNMFKGFNGGGEGGWGDLGQGLGGIFNGMFRGRNEPEYDMGNTQNYLDQIRPEMDKYLSPYINAGQQANQTLSGQYQNLLGQNPSAQYQELANNPNAVMNRLGAGYQQSPGYQHQVNQMTNASNNAAAAGGFIGSPQQQYQMAQGIGGLANQDYNKYLNNVMGLQNRGLGGMSNMYGQGLQGMQGISNQGYGAAMGGNQTISDMLKGQAEMSYADAMNRYNSKLAQQQAGMGSNDIGNMFGGFGSVLSGIGSIFGL